MKKSVFSLVCVIQFLTSCSYRDPTPDIIRDNARKYECVSILNSLLEGYIRVYYTSPVNKESLISFVEECEKKDKWFKQGINHTDFEMIKMLYDKQTYFASFQDSSFIYMENGPFGKVGCCVIGTPSFWLEYPELYPMDRLDYNDWFNTSAFSFDGEYLFPVEFNYSALNNIIDSLSANYYSFICYSGEVVDTYSPLIDKPTLINKWIPVRAVVLYDFLTDNLSIISHIPKENIFCYTNATMDPISINEAIEDLQQHFILDFKQTLRTFLTESAQCKRIIATVYLKTNYSKTD